MLYNGEQGADTATEMSEDEANALFRHSEQTWLEHDRDPLLQASPPFPLTHARTPLT